MNNILRYIDRCIIDEHAIKSFNRGYSLDIDDVPEIDRTNLLDMLMQEDTGIRDIVLHHMQKLINERLKECESEDMQAARCKRAYRSNGDTYLIRERG